MLNIGGPLDTMVFSAEAVGGLPHNETTIAEALREMGYATMAIGKVREQFYF